MSAVAIDRTKGSRKVFLCPHELAAEIDTWRATQRPIPSESAAVVELVRRALERWRKDQREKRKQS